MDNLPPGNHSAATTLAVADGVQSRQESFLDGYRKHGTIRKGCQLAAIHRDSVRRWRSEDIFGFNQRFTDAHDDFVDHVEGLLYGHVEQIKSGQNPLAYFSVLNANRPEKWRPNVKVQLEVPNEVIQQLRALQELGKQEPKGLPEPQTVEGKAEVLPWE